jgi:hypothetical protein
MLGGADPMGMVVDQPRNDGAPGKIDDPRLWPPQRLDLARTADFDDALAPERKRLW